MEIDLSPAGAFSTFQLPSPPDSLPDGFLPTNGPALTRPAEIRHAASQHLLPLRPFNPLLQATTLEDSVWSAEAPRAAVRRSRPHNISVPRNSESDNSATSSPDYLFSPAPGSVVSMAPNRRAITGGTSTSRSTGQTYSSNGHTYGSNGQTYSSNSQSCGSNDQSYSSNHTYGSNGQTYSSSSQTNGSNGQSYGSNGQSYGSNGQPCCRNGQPCCSNGQTYGKGSNSQAYGSNGRTCCSNGQTYGNGSKGQTYGSNGQAYVTSGWGVQAYGTSGWGVQAYSYSPLSPRVYNRRQVSWLDVLKLYVTSVNVVANWNTVPR